MTLPAYARIFRRHWPTLVLPVLLAVLAAALASLLETPEYTANAQLFVAARDESPYQAQLFAQQRVRSYVDVVDSEPVMSGVIADLGLRMSPEELARRITATVSPETVLLNISATSGSAAQAQTIANTTATVFIAYAESLERIDRSGPAPVAITVIRPAALPTSPSSPQVPFNLTLGLLIGVLTGVGAVWVRARLEGAPDPTGQMTYRVRGRARVLSPRRDLSRAPALGIGRAPVPGTGRAPADSVQILTQVPVVITRPDRDKTATVYRPPFVPVAEDHEAADEDADADADAGASAGSAQPRTLPGRSPNGASVSPDRGAEPGRPDGLVHPPGEWPPRLADPDS